MSAYVREDVIRLPPIVTPELLEPELRAVTRAGGYGTEREAIGHALETLLVANRSLRVDTAVALYRDGDVTLSRAAEIADMELESFKEKLSEVGVRIQMDESPEEVHAGAERIRQWRSAQ